MGVSNYSGRPGKSLRKKAEELLGRQPGRAQDATAEDVNKLIHELQVYQIELEMQNDELLRAHVELEESRSKYYDLYELAPTGYFVIDAKGLIREVNLTGTTMLGIERQHLLGTAFSRYVSKDFQGVFHQHCQTALDTQMQQENELKIIRKDKSTFFVQIIGLAQPTPEGGMDQCRISVLDISDRVLMEERNRESMEQLKQANHLKDLFADIIRHDLLNPVGVVGHVSKVLAEDERLRGSEELEMLIRNGTRIREIVQNASELAKLQNIQDLKKGEEDLCAFVLYAIKSVRFFAERKGQKIVFEPQGEMRARVNPLIQDVFINILSNATKYSPELSTITAAIVDEGRSWFFSVADPGEGVPDEFKETIFNRFERRERLGVKGTGLGLAISRRVVELHGGRIWLEDNPEGQGSLFCVRIPS